MNTRSRRLVLQRRFFASALRIAVAAAVITVPGAGSASDLSNGLDFYYRGKFDEARPLLRRAHERGGSDPSATLAFARVLLHGDSAVLLYRRVADSKNAPDSVRREALMRLGQSRYALGDLPAAAAWFSQACEIREDTLCMAMLRLCGISRPRASAGTGETESQNAMLVATGSGRHYYAVQVGSFAVVANARQSVERLKEEFPQIGIRPVVVDGATLYRVRIGRFDSESAAVTFGMERLRPKGITFRAVRDSVAAVAAETIR